MRIHIILFLLFCWTASSFAQLNDNFRYASVHTVQSREGYSVFYPILKEEYKGIVVIIHSNQIFNPASYGGLIEVLLKQNYLVVFPSYQSFLQSNSSLDIDYISKSLVSAYEDIKVGYQDMRDLPVAYIGHSMGGIIAYELTSVDPTIIKNPACIISVCPAEVQKHKIENINFKNLDNYDLYLVIEEQNDKHYKKGTGERISKQLDSAKRMLHQVHEKKNDETSNHVQLWSYDKRFSSGDNGFPDYYARIVAKENETDLNFYYPVIVDALSCAFERKNCDSY